MNVEEYRLQAIERWLADYQALESNAPAYDLRNEAGVEKYMAARLVWNTRMKALNHYPDHDIAWLCTTLRAALNDVARLQGVQAQANGRVDEQAALAAHADANWWAQG